MVYTRTSKSMNCAAAGADAALDYPCLSHPGKCTESPAGEQASFVIPAGQQPGAGLVQAHLAHSLAACSVLRQRPLWRKRRQIDTAGVAIDDQFRKSQTTGRGI